MKKTLMIVGLLVATSALAEMPSRVAAVERQAGTIPGPGCEDGVVLDDGTVETAYSWVPSAVWGEYVQTFAVAPSRSSRLDSVCICWTRTHVDETLDFEVVVYSGSQSVPGQAELFSFPASVSDIPEWPDAAFFEIQAPVDGPVLNAGRHHIGVRWNPSADQFIFLCADHSPTDSPVPGFFRDDRSEGEWGEILDTSDPIFDDHAALMVRVRAHRVAWIPTLGIIGLSIMAFLLAISGWVVLRSR